MAEAEMRKLTRSIETFGLVEPLVVRRSDQLVIGGHQRLDAAKALGMARVPVVYVELSDAQAKALNLALNRIQGEFDLPKLGELLDELRELPDFDVALTGFDGPEIDDLLAELEHQQPLPEFEEDFDVGQAMAEAEQRTAPTRVHPGDLWELGKHRLLCGDATDASAWDRLMAGKLAQAVVTDPPYAINYLGGRAAQKERISARRRGTRGQQGDAYWDDLTADEYRALLTASLGLAHKHSDNKAPLYLWFASSHLRDVLDCLRECGWQERNLLVWVKNNGAGALFAQYKHWYEPCMYAFKTGKSPRWFGPTNERTVWEHDKPAVNDLHPTMKPVPLIERSITNSTSRRHLVVDCFLGSGTAIIAAQRTERICYGMERDARYCDVILARWEALTGDRAARVKGEEER
jgi:DNA modification methylase